MIAVPVVPGVRVVTGVHVVAVVLVRAPIAASDAEGDVGSCRPCPSCCVLMACPYTPRGYKLAA